MTRPLPVLDAQPLQDLLDLGAAPDLVTELVELLRLDVPARQAALRKALEDLDQESGVLEAHQLKGALGTMGLLRFSDLAGRIEAHLREGQWREARGLLEALPAAYQEALAALRATFPWVTSTAARPGPTG